MGWWFFKRGGEGCAGGHPLRSLRSASPCASRRGGVRRYGSTMERGSAWGGPPPAPPEGGGVLWLY